MKAKTKRYISLFLALVFCFSLLGTFPAFAATTVQAYMVNYPRQNDPNYGDSRFGHSANYLMSGWDNLRHSHRGDHTRHRRKAERLQLLSGNLV